LPAGRTRLQKYSAPALEKGLEILEFLSQQDTGKALSQIAEGINRSGSEIFRMVIVLEESGYLSRTDADEYYLTEKMFQVGLRNPRLKRIWEVATPLMRLLSGKTNHCCYLSVANANSMIVVAKSESPIQFGVSAEIGHRHQLLNSASGTCLMAYMTIDSRESLISSAEQSGIRVDRPITQAMLEKCRTQSFVTLPSLVIAGIQDIAAPVLDPKSRQAVAALTIPYFGLIGFQTSIDEIASDLVSATKEIQYALG